jgi:aryl-alcohol dehydrogenase-like predicted oxidoreductase
MLEMVDRMPAHPVKQRWRAGVGALSELGIGCSRAGSISNPAPISEIKRTLSAALDLGVNVFDTANIYGGGESERMIGGVVKGRKDKVFVVTKIGFKFSESAKLARYMKFVLRPAVRNSSTLQRALLRGRDASLSQDFSPAGLQTALEGSLQRLGMEPGGLLLHDPSAETLRKDEVIDFLNRAKTQGKVRHFGASVNTLEALAAALEIDGLELLQTDMTLARKIASLPNGEAVSNGSVALLIRQILRPPGMTQEQKTKSPKRAIAEALALPGAASAIIGISTRKHLDSAVDALQ